MNTKELAEGIYKSFSEGDLEEVINALSNDVVWELVGPSCIPYFGNYFGKEGVRKFFANLFEHEEVIEFIPEKYISEGDTVAVIGHERCRSKLTGKEYRARWVQIFKSSNSKITEWREYIDTAPIVDAYIDDIPSTGPF